MRYRYVPNWARRAGTPITQVDAAIAAINAATPGAITFPVGATEAQRRDALANYARTQPRDSAATYTPPGWTEPAGFDWRAIGTVAAVILGVVVIAFLLFGRPGWIYRVGDNGGSTNISVQAPAADTTPTPTQKQTAASPSPSNTTTPPNANTSIDLGDPRVATIFAAISNGTIKSASDLDKAIASSKPTFTDAQVKAAQAQLGAFVKASQSGSTPTAGNGNGTNVTGNAEANVTNWQVPAPPSADLNNSGFTKVEIDNAGQNIWNHRVFNMILFHAPNWDGADSWFNTLAVGPNTGGFWTSQGNQGTVVYRGNTTHLSWCIADLTTSSWNGIDLKSQFLSRSNPSLPAQMSIKQLTPNSVVAVKTHSGEVKSQAASDIGDITIVLPDNGVTSVCVDYTTAAPTAEAFVAFGPRDRTDNIDIIDASK